MTSKTSSGSEPIYDVVSERNVYVEMRDEVSLAVDVFRPEAEGEFPALLAISPYGKGIQTLTMPPLPPQAPFWNGAIEAGDPEYIVSRGYAHVIADVRGTGKSEGDYRGWMSKKEAEDGYDLVEWIAGQPWCDGNVGMAGISYFGTIQLAVAAEGPPHLKAIMPFNAPADFYRECAYHGGILQTFFDALYSRYIGGGISVTLEGLSPEEQEKVTEEVRSNPDFVVYPQVYNIADNPNMSPCFFDVLANPTDGPFYWERSAYPQYDEIKVPSYFGSGWWAYGHQHLAGAFRNYLGIDAPKKLLINEPVTEHRPLPEWYNTELIRWYDYWLKGVDTGIMDETPIKIYVMGDNEWRTESEWPLARTQWTKSYLRRWEGLSPEPETFPGKPDCFVQQPLDETSRVHSVQYMSRPMSEDLEVTGPVALYLYASIDQEDTNWMVALRDVAPDGSELELNRGFLKASHRAVDESKSEPWKPYHPHRDPEPVVPGEIHEYAIELNSMSNVFKVGHRIKLEITSMDHPRALPARIEIGGPIHLPYHVCSSKTTFHKIYHEEEYPSHLLLPVTPR
jgi:predicted acyl esterase